ncbi:hypothetical protein ACS0TY_008532 [Phlomoides rotata]
MSASPSLSRSPLGVARSPPPPRHSHHTVAVCSHSRILCSLSRQSIQMYGGLLQAWRIISQRLMIGKWGLEYIFHFIY